MPESARLSLGRQHGEHIHDCGKIPGLRGKGLDHCNVRAAPQRVAFLSTDEIKTSVRAQAKTKKGIPPIQLPASRTWRRSVRTCQRQGLFQRRRSPGRAKAIGTARPTPRPSPSTATSLPRHRGSFRCLPAPLPAAASGRHWLHRCHSYGIGSDSGKVSLALLPPSVGFAPPVRSLRAKWQRTGRPRCGPKPMARPASRACPFCESPIGTVASSTRLRRDPAPAHAVPALEAALRGLLEAMRALSGNGTTKPCPLRVATSGAGHNGQDDPNRRSHDVPIEGSAIPSVIALQEFRNGVAFPVPVGATARGCATPSGDTARSPYGPAKVRSFSPHRCQAVLSIPGPHCIAWRQARLSALRMAREQETGEKGESSAGTALCRRRPGSTHCAPFRCWRTRPCEVVTTCHPRQTCQSGAC